MSRQHKRDGVLRLLRGEDLETVWRSLAVLEVAIAIRRAGQGCVHHSDRGSEYAAERCRKKLTEHGIKDSIERRGNPYDNAKAESFMKTLKAKAVYRMGHQTFGELADNLPSLVDEVYTQMVTFGAGISKSDAVRGTTRPADGQNSRMRLSTAKGGHSAKSLGL